MQGWWPQLEVAPVGKALVWGRLKGSSTSAGHHKPLLPGNCAQAIVPIVLETSSRPANWTARSCTCRAGHQPVWRDSVPWSLLASRALTSLSRVAPRIMALCMEGWMRILLSRIALRQSCTQSGESASPTRCTKSLRAVAGFRSGAWLTCGAANLCVAQELF